MIFPLSSGSSFSAAMNRPISRCHSAAGPLANRYLIMKCFIVGSLKFFPDELRAALRAAHSAAGRGSVCCRLCLRQTRCVCARERSDEAIQTSFLVRQWIASLSLATTAQILEPFDPDRSWGASMDKNDTMDFVAHARMLPKQRNAFAGAR